MAVSELEFDELQKKYPGITREDVEGKTEEKIEHDWFRKRFRERYFPKGYFEMCDRVGPALDTVLKILEEDRAAEKKEKDKNVFGKKIEQFYDILRWRKEYKNARENCIGALWYITDTAETRYRNPKETHQENGCIFRNIGITVDGQCVPDGTYEDGSDYCEFFDWDKPCHKQTCQYHGQNSAAIENIRDCEMAHEKLRIARKRFWGLEK